MTGIVVELNSGKGSHEKFLTINEKFYRNILLRKLSGEENEFEVKIASHSKELEARNRLQAVWQGMKQTFECVSSS